MISSMYAYLSIVFQHIILQAVLVWCVTKDLVSISRVAPSQRKVCGYTKAQLRIASWLDLFHSSAGHIKSIWVTHILFACTCAVKRICKCVVCVPGLYLWSWDRICSLQTFIFKSWYYNCQFSESKERFSLYWISKIIEHTQVEVSFNSLRKFLFFDFILRIVRLRNIRFIIKKVLHENIE